MKQNGKKSNMVLTNQSEKRGVYQLLSSIGKFFLDLLFPIECLGCGREGAWLCQNCFERIPLNNFEICPSCQKFSNNGQTHLTCQRGCPLDGLLSASSYDYPLMKKLITNLKYHSLTDLARPLAKLMAERLRFYGFFIEENWLLVPIPLHRRRYLERGFNQAELLCQVLQELTGLSWLPALKRKFLTPPQAELNREDRLINLKNIFTCESRFIKNKKIILVDDVFTTGATLREGARVLKLNGAQEVWGLVLARG
jgi:competence protein ComFC